MSDQVATVTTSAPAAAAPPAVDEAAFASLLGLDDAPAAKAAPEGKPEPSAPAAAAKPEPAGDKSVVPKVKEPIDPLDEADFDEAKLSSPAALKAARDRLLKARQQQVELTRAAHRAHGAAGRRETALQSKEAKLAQREAAVTAYDSAFRASIADLQSGDPDKFLTAIHRLGNVGDPAGFWRNVSLKLASGGTFTEAEKKQAQADPEIQRRLEQIESALKAKEEREQQSAEATLEQNVEARKQEALELAAKNTATPRVVAYATDPRTQEATKAALGKIALTEYRRLGRPIDISRACEILEEELSVHYELSQRANGTAQASTNRENGTTGSGPEAGRVTSQEPPKPGTSQATIPATLSSSPGGAQRPLSETEQRELQIRQLEAAGFF